MPENPLLEWFAGGSVASYSDLDGEIVSGFVGVRLPEALMGFDQSVRLEVGYGTLDVSDGINGLGNIGGGGVPGGGGGGGGVIVDRKDAFEAGRVSPRRVAIGLQQTFSLEYDIVPLTLNYQLGRDLGRNFSFYISAGLGAAFIDADVSGNGQSASDSDTVFLAQASTGVAYSVTANLDVFAGAKYLYFDQPEFFGGQVPSEFDNSDLGFEVGVSWRF